MCEMILTFVIVVSLLVTDVYVGACSKGKLYTNGMRIPHKPAALVLGCGKYTQGRLNLYYQYRIDAAVELWQTGKIDAILVSGDNSRKDYNEPSGMRADLIARGVPADYIAVDYAGFRTLDSIVRADKIFGLQDYIVVSQPFHCQRAIYLANQKGQSVIGYCATDVRGGSGIKTRLRETLARTNALLDILTDKQPQYLGPREIIRYRE